MTTEIVRNVERYIRPGEYEIGDVEVTVNLAQIGRALGSRAMRNKSGKAKYMHGAVVVKVVGRWPR
jgi:hypothetical protein